MPATAICSLSRNFWKLVYDMPTTTAPHPLTVVSCVCSSCSSSVLSISNSAALARHRPQTSKTGGCASFQFGMHKFSFRRSIPSPLSHYAELWLADDCSKTPSFSTPPREASVPLFFGLCLMLERINTLDIKLPMESALYLLPANPTSPSNGFIACRSARVSVC